MDDDIEEGRHTFRVDTVEGRGDMMEVDYG
jgi:hypothetical protein